VRFQYGKKRERGKKREKEGKRGKKREKEGSSGIFS
jgi:hypothetical protein